MDKIAVEKKLEQTLEGIGGTNQARYCSNGIIGRNGE